MPVVTKWKWKNLNEDVLVEAMAALAELDYPEGYQNLIFADGSGGVTITPDGEDPEAAAVRAHVFSKYCHLGVHHAMTEEQGLALGTKVVEVLKKIS